MDNTRFPSECGKNLGDKTFIEVFQTQPKTVEFVNRTWLADKTTGLFGDFLTYVKTRLQIPDVRAEHEKRCDDYVKSHDGDLPDYMTRYNKRPSL